MEVGQKKQYPSEPPKKKLITLGLSSQIPKGTSGCDLLHFAVSPLVKHLGDLQPL